MLVNGSTATDGLSGNASAGGIDRFLARLAAEAGVRMAQLAARGFTSPPGAVEGRFGLLHVMSGESARPELLTADLGQHWAVEHVYVKLYPCCAWIQAAAQELVRLRGSRPLQPEEIAKVQVGVSAYAGAFKVCAAFALIAAATSLLLRETRGQNIYHELHPHDAPAVR